MRDYWVLDAETDPFKFGRIPKPFLWGVYTGSVFEHFDTVDEMLGYVCEHPVIVYAHNGGRFDYHFLLEHLEPFKPITIINGRLAKFKIGLAEFRDSFNILPVPLAAYKKTQIDYDIFESGKRDTPDNRREIISYLRDDCVDLHHLIGAFLNEHGPVLTQATASLKAWEKQSETKAPISDAEYFDRFKVFYYGGRVQCFQSGHFKKDFKVVDINSAYPRAMLEDHPLSLEHIVIKRGPKLNVIEGPDFYVVRGVSRGAFPFRGEKGGLEFPDDKKVRVYHVTGWELQAAIDTKTLHNYTILERINFDERISFREYITGCWEARLRAKAEGNKAADIIEKLKMNSLYGRFAINPRNFAAYTLYPPELLGEIGVSLRRGKEIVEGEENNEEFGGFLGKWAIGEDALSDDEHRFLNVATSASITGYVRAFLWRSIKSCKGVMYCDTDSITAEVIEGLDFGKGLGQWGLEGEFSEGAIGGKKLYAFKDKNTGVWKCRSKGVKLNHKEIIKVAKGGNVRYTSDVPTFSHYSLPSFSSRNIKATF